MDLRDLKVLSANVQVSNQNQVLAKYNISANFRTSNGVLKYIDGGSVVLKESNKQLSFFHKSYEEGGSLHISYVNDISEDINIQCEINQFIMDFIDIAQEKAINEVSD